MRNINRMFCIVLAFIIGITCSGCSVGAEDINSVVSVVSTIVDTYNDVKDGTNSVNSVDEFPESGTTTYEVNPEMGEKTEEGGQEEKTDVNKEYTFRNDKLLTQHYEKHGIEMGFSDKNEYQKAASAVVNNPKALHKLEAEDGDDIYYIEDTNEFVVVSTDGFIRTYFKPSSGIKYYNKQ